MQQSDNHLHLRPSLLRLFHGVLFAAVLWSTVGGSIKASDPGEPLRSDDLLAADPAHLQCLRQPSDHPPWLVIKDVAALSVETIALAPARATGLSMPSLRELSDELAILLAGYRGDLAIDGLAVIRPRCAWMLVSPSEAGFARLLSLNGLTAVDQESADAFARHRGGLSLNGIERIDLKIARSLCRTDGVLSMRGLTALTPAEATCFATRTHLTLLPSREMFGSEVSEELAENPQLRFDGSYPSDETPFGTDE